MAQPATYKRSDGTTYRKRTITQVGKTIREKGEWRGFAVPNKVNPDHFFDGWCLAVDRIFKSQNNLDDLVDIMLYCMDPELGDRVAFYEETEIKEAMEEIETKEIMDEGD